MKLKKLPKQPKESAPIRSWERYKERLKDTIAENKKRMEEPKRKEKIVLETRKMRESARR